MKRIALLLLFVFALQFSNANPLRIALVGGNDCSSEIQGKMGSEYDVRWFRMNDKGVFNFLPDVLVVDAVNKDEVSHAISLTNMPSFPKLFILTSDDAMVREVSRRRFNSIQGKSAQEILNGLYSYGIGSKKIIKVLFIGDSITDGLWGGKIGQSETREHNDCNHVLGHGYQANIATYYLNKYPKKGYWFYNRGLSGDKLYGMSARWDKDAVAIQPDVVSILIGVNDTDAKVLATLDLNKWESVYRSILDRIKSCNPNVRIVLCTPFCSDHSIIMDTYPQRLPAVNRYAEIIRRVAKDYGAVLVDFNKMFDQLIANDQSMDKNYWIWDGIHPNYAGHGKMTDLWIKTAGKVMK